MTENSCQLSERIFDLIASAKGRGMEDLYIISALAANMQLIADESQDPELLQDVLSCLTVKVEEKIPEYLLN